MGEPVFGHLLVLEHPWQDRQTSRVGRGPPGGASGIGGEIPLGRRAYPEPAARADRVVELVQGAFALPNHQHVPVAGAWIWIGGAAPLALHGFDRPITELAVLAVLEHVEINVAVRDVGKTLVDEPLDQPDDFVDVVRGPRKMIDRVHAHRG